MKRCKADAFTLIELLVVVAIISILAGLLLPALTSARERAQSAVCTQRLNQFSIAERCYANDNHGCPSYMLNDDYHYWWGARCFLVAYDYIPWDYYIKYYSGGRPAVRTMDSKGWQKSWGCPSQKFRPGGNRTLQADYGENIKTPWLKFHSVKSPSKLIFWGDVRGRSYVYYDKDDWPCRHLGGDNFVFYDGHTERWLFEKMVRCIVWSDSITDPRLALYNGKIYGNGTPYAD